MNFIGDVHGRFDQLMALLKILPDEEFMCLGDLIDRGLQSRQVVEFVRKHGRSLRGNHEEFMYRYVNRPTFETALWVHERNGGKETLLSYGIDWNKHEKPDPKIWDQLETDAEWMKTLPYFYREPGLLATHAPFEEHLRLSNLDGDMHHYTKEALLWSQSLPIQREGIFQVHGHMRQYMIYGDWGKCIDGLGNELLIGLNWPSGKIYGVHNDGTTANLPTTADDARRSEIMAAKES